MTHPIIEDLRRERVAGGLSQDGLASSFGTAQNLLSRYEMGKTSPTLESLSRWAQALNYEIRLVKKP
jgi:transcriptional regulator with XRE-family HTH domain